jgi:hypothetical protein
MTHYAGLDASLEDTAICIVDRTGRIVREARAASEPQALIAALKGIDLPLERIGLEACSLTAWLHDELRRAGLPAICIETRQANAAMTTMPIKTDRNDARALWPDPGALPIRRHRYPGQDQPMRRRTRPHCALRSGTRPAGAQPQMVEPAGLGHEGRQAPRHGAGQGGGGPQARRRPASDVERWNRVPVQQGTDCQRWPCRGLKQLRRTHITNSLARANRIVPVGTMGEVISLRVQSLGCKPQGRGPDWDTLHL